MSGTIPQLSCWSLQGSVLLVPLRISCQKWGHVFPQWHCMLCCTSCAPALSHSLHQALAAVSIVLLSSLNTISTPLWGNGYRSRRFLWSDVSCADQDVWKQLAGAVFLGTGFGYKRARTCLKKQMGSPQWLSQKLGLPERYNSSLREFKSVSETKLHEAWRPAQQIMASLHRGELLCGISNFKKDNNKMPLWKSTCPGFSGLFVLTSALPCLLSPHRQIWVKC